MDEVTRIEKIDKLAADMMRVMRQYDGAPATEVWDRAAEIVDAAESTRQREAAWAADRQMVADMERDGLL